MQQPTSQPSPRLSPTPAWQLWLVRLLLACLTAHACLLVLRALAQARTHYQLPPINGVEQHRVQIDSGQYLWAFASLVCAAGFGAALVFSVRRRLRRVSWKPLAGLALVLIPATVAVLGFESGVF